MLGDLQKRRDRRQKVGDDLFDDRYERSTSRQFLELFKGGDFHWLEPVNRGPPRERLRPRIPSIFSTPHPASCGPVAARRSTIQTAAAPGRRAFPVRRSSDIPPRPLLAAILSLAGCRRGRTRSPSPV